MACKADGIVYYCRLPGHAAQFGSEIARQMLKRGFAEFFQEDFEEGKIGRKGHGKPYYEGNGQIQFNISHCKDAVAVAVSDRPLGIDVEGMRRVNRIVVEKCCDGRELFYVFNGTEDGVAGREQLSEAETMRFLHLWTLKESYVKMTGEGLSLPFHTVNFNVSGLASLKKGQEREISGDGRRNRFFLYPAESFVMALAVQGGEKTGKAGFIWKEMEFGDIWQALGHDA